MHRKSTVALIFTVFSFVVILGFTDVYAEVVSLTVDVQTILLEPGQVIPLLDTKSVGNMSKLQVSATLPCDGSHVPKLKIIAGSLGNLTDVIDSSSDYGSMTGPFGTCFFSDMISPKSNLPILNKVFLKNDGSSSIITNLGSVITISGIIGNQTTAQPFTYSTVYNQMDATGDSAHNLGLASQTRTGLVLGTGTTFEGKIINTVSFQAKKVGSPSYTISVKVRDSSGTIKGQSLGFPTSNLTTSYVTYKETLDSDVTLVAGDRILVEVNSADGTNYVSVRVKPNVSTPNGFQETIYNGGYADDTTHTPQMTFHAP